MLKINDNNKPIIPICTIVHTDMLFACLLFECFGKKAAGGHVTSIFLNSMVFKPGSHN